MLIDTEEMDLFSIGEFSTASSIPVRTLRFYHEEGILIPAAVDGETNYRLYDGRNLEVARVIVALRELEFPLDDIRTILAECGEDIDVITHLERRKASLQEKMSHCRSLIARIDGIIRAEQDARQQDAQNGATFHVEEQSLQPVKVAGVRMTGRYSDCGQGFSKLFMHVGRYAIGKPMCLFYDGEYRADDASFEPCVPVRKEVAVDGIIYHDLPGGRCLSLTHRGPYEQLSRSYARIMQLVKQHGYNVDLPTREVYLKGPGMLLRGNPRKYLTEIQLLIQS